MNTQQLPEPITFEVYLASMRENDRYIREKFAETDRLLKEQAAEFDRSIIKSRAEHEQRMKKIEETMGAWSNNHGSFAEEYFFNSFEQNRTDFFGEKFDEIEPNLKGIKKGFRDEYDIVLINGKSIGIIEVKYKAHKNDVQKTLRKAETFRVNFPEFKNHRVYLGIATLVSSPTMEQAFAEEGIAIVKQVGETVVIYDEHLKVF